MPANKNILCLQNNNHFKEIISWTFALADPSIKVLHATNSYEAMEALQQSQNCIAIITGYYLPELLLVDGTDLARHIHNLGYQMPIIAFSCLIGSYRKEKDYTTGITHHVPKPDVTQLLQACKELHLIKKNPLATA